MKKCLIALCLSMLSLLTGCITQRDIRYTDHFSYEVVRGEVIYILNLTEEGKEQEYIIIPGVIDGLQVVALGRTPGFLVSGDGRFDSVNLKRVYFSHRKYQIDIPNSFFNTPNMEVITSASTLWTYSASIYMIQNNVIWLPVLIANYIRLENESSDLISANVSYMYNYEEAPNQGYYLADDYDNEVIAFIPPDPRREGFIFDGWYKDEETTISWDFQNDLIPAKVENEYFETKLYAKWIKIGE